MKKYTRCVLIATGFSLTVLTTGCVPLNEYYTEATSSGSMFLKAAEGPVPIGITETHYHATNVRGYWPNYNRRYSRRAYYYSW